MFSYFEMDPTQPYETEIYTYHSWGDEADYAPQMADLWMSTGLYL